MLSKKSIIMHQLSKNVLIGLTGEYFVCAELSNRGIIAVLAPKNNPEIDVIATTSNGSRFVNIQVKTMSVENKQGWKLNKNIENKIGSKNFFVVLVNLTEVGQTPEFYIFGRDELAGLVKENYQRYLSKPKRDGGQKKDIGFRWFDFREFPEHLRKKKLNNWKLLGLWKK